MSDLMMESGVSRVGRLIKINDKTFVTGLQWWGLGKPSTAKKEMQEQAKSRKMNLGLVYAGIALQAGLARVPSGEVKAFDGAWSLAAVLSTKLGPSWFGVFDLDDGNFATIAVNDGRVIPGCDEVGDFEATQSLIQSMGAMYSWSKIYISDERLTQGLDESVLEGRTIQDILGKDKRWDSSLKPLTLQSGIKPWVLMARAATVVLVGAGAWWKFYAEHRAEIARQEVIDQQNAALGAKRLTDIRQAQQLVDDRTIKPSWPNEPAASAVISVCVQGLNRLPVSIAGWVLQSMSCTGPALDATYARSVGSTMALFDAAARRMRDSGAISSYTVLAEKGTVKMLDKSLMPRGDQPLLDFRPWSMTWLSHFQSLNLPVHMDKVNFPPPPPPERSLIDLLGKEKAVPPPPWWETYKWTFDVEGPSAIDVLEPLMKAQFTTGFVIKKISKTFSDSKSSTAGAGAWHAEGEIHVRP